MSTRYVAFIRAVMIGREGLHRQVLLDIFSEAGANHPVSYISTGNVSFEVSPDRLEAVVEEVAHEISEVVARPTEVFVRSEPDLRSMVASDPYADQPLSVDHGAEVTFFLDAVPPNLDLPFQSSRDDIVVFRASERELFSVSVRSGGLSRGAGGLIAATTGERITTRSWSTVLRILEKLETS